MFAKIINQETKEVIVVEKATSEFITANDFREMEVEQDYKGAWFVKGFAPEKPESIINQEKVSEARKYLQDTDYIWNVIREGDATEEHYADVISKRKEARELIRSLEND